MFGSCGIVGTSAVVQGVWERTLIGEHVANSLTAFPTHRLFIESVFGVMANVGALPLDCNVLHEVREVHEDAVRQSDHDDDLRSVAVPSPLFQGDPVDLAQDAMPIWNVLFEFGNFLYQKSRIGKIHPSFVPVLSDDRRGGILFWC